MEVWHKHSLQGLSNNHTCPESRVSAKPPCVTLYKLTNQKRVEIIKKVSSFSSCTLSLNYQYPWLSIISSDCSYATDVKALIQSRGENSSRVLSITEIKEGKLSSSVCERHDKKRKPVKNIASCFSFLR